MKWGESCCRTLSPDEAARIRSVHSNKRRMLWVEAEPGFHLHAVRSDLPLTSYRLLLHTFRRIDDTMPSSDSTPSQSIDRNRCERRFEGGVARKPRRRRRPARVASTGVLRVSAALWNYTRRSRGGRKGSRDGKATEVLGRMDAGLGDVEAAVSGRATAARCVEAPQHRL
jgi:hypothetical protein